MTQKLTGLVLTVTVNSVGVQNLYRGALSFFRKPSRHVILCKTMTPAWYVHSNPSLVTRDRV